MPNNFSPDPRRLGYVCDDYDLPVRDLLTGTCYPNFCIAEANGVKNWDYECDPEIRFPAPIDETGAAPPPSAFVYGGSDDGGWDGGNTLIGGSGPPWRTRRPGGSYGPWWGPSGGGGATSTSPPPASTSPGPTGPGSSASPPGRTVDWHPRPGRTLFGGSDTPSSGGRIHSNPGTGPGATLIGDGTPSGSTLSTTGGRRIHSNPSGTGPGATLIGDGTQSTSTTLATAGGSRIHSNPSGTGPGATLIGDGTQSGGATLATASPSTGPVQYYAQPTRQVAVTRRREEMHLVSKPQQYQTAPRREEMHLVSKPQQYQTVGTVRSSSPHLTLSRAQIRAISSGRTTGRMTGGRPISRSMHGLGDLDFSTPVGALAIFGGALLLGTYLVTR